MIIFLLGLHVWIVGQDIISLAQKRAALRHFSEFRQFANLLQFNWFNFSGDFHLNLCNFIFNLLSSFPCPDILILQFDSYLLGNCDTLSLINFSRFEFSRLHNVLPNSFIIFSEFLPVPAWSVKSFSYKFKILKRLNRFFHKLLPSLNGISFRHVDIESSVSGFFEKDGVQLSKIGLDMLNLDIASMVDLGLARLGVATC